MSDDSLDTPQSDKSARDPVVAESLKVVVMGEIMREWPRDLFIPPDALEVVLESFEGPLDLLLYLIRKQNLRERMTQVLALLKRDGYVRFEDLFTEAEGRLGVVVTFIALLELCRDDMLVIVQNEPYAPIHIKQAA